MGATKGVVLKSRRQGVKSTKKKRKTSRRDPAEEKGQGNEGESSTVTKRKETSTSRRRRASDKFASQLGARKKKISGKNHNKREGKGGGRKGKG